MMFMNRCFTCFHSVMFCLFIRNDQQHSGQMFLLTGTAGVVRVKEWTDEKSKKLSRGEKKADGGVNDQLRSVRLI